MSAERVASIRSYIIVFYRGLAREVARFLVPGSVVAPFVNRLFAEALPGIENTLREPWYVLLPRYADELPFRRADYPLGPTSLYGRRYAPVDELPPRLTLHPDAAVRYFTVRLLDFDREIYRGEYSVDDIFLSGVEHLARKRIEPGTPDGDDGPDEDRRLYYAIVPSTQAVYTVSADLFPPDVYQVEGVFQLPPPDRERGRIAFRRVAPPPLPEYAPPGGGAGTWASPAPGQIAMPARVYRLLQAELPLSARNENGGYLLGAAYRLPGSPPDETGEGFRWRIEIDDVALAENAWGRPGLLVFTGDSWSQITRRLDLEPENKLLGWFHTHLFSATDAFGLSGLDQDLHRRYLTKPWQVAVLLNIDADGQRTVRAFQRGPAGDLVECSFEVIEP